MFNQQFAKDLAQFMAYYMKALKDSGFNQMEAMNIISGLQSAVMLSIIQHYQDKKTRGLDYVSSSLKYFPVGLCSCQSDPGYAQVNRYVYPSGRWNN